MTLETIPPNIHTFTGLLVNPLDLQPEDIHVEDIAHALAAQCRFQGHTREFYSVAQHSVLVSRLVPDEFALDGLLHDASEAYLQDMARPLKLHPTVGQAYRAAEKRAQRVISGVFGFASPEPEEVKEADTRLLVTEARDLMHGSGTWGYYQDIEPLPKTIDGWTPRRAEREFLARFEGLRS